jgi:hypothetical protein
LAAGHAVTHGRTPWRGFRRAWHGWALLAGGGLGCCYGVDGGNMAGSNQAMLCLMSICIQPNVGSNCSTRLLFHTSYWLEWSGESVESTTSHTTPDDPKIETDTEAQTESIELVLRLALLLSSEGTTRRHQPQHPAPRAPQIDFGFNAPSRGGTSSLDPFLSTCPWIRSCQRSFHPRTPISAPRPNDKDDASPH